VRSQHPFTSRANSLAPFTAGQAALFYPDVHPVVVLKESSRRKIIVRYRHIYISRFYVVQYPPAARCGSSCGSTRAPADPRVRQRMHIGWLRFLGGNRRRHPRRTNGKIKETVSRLCTASVYRADCLVSIICRRGAAATLPNGFPSFVLSVPSIPVYVHPLAPNRRYFSRYAARESARDTGALHSTQAISRFRATRRLTASSLSWTAAC